MFNRKYRLSYLPDFYRDLDEKAAYITHVLKNPAAAASLTDRTEQAILRRLPNCESFPRYRSRKDRGYPLYFINVSSFMILYVVLDAGGDERIMEIRRFLYKRQLL